MRHLPCGQANGEVITATGRTPEAVRIRFRFNCAFTASPLSFNTSE
jgi:hypothetical protein